MRELRTYVRGAGWRFLGVLVMPAAWWVATEVVGVSGRYLPSIRSVTEAWRRVDPPIWVHASYTASRLLVGFVVGTALGIALALIMARSRAMWNVLIPSVQSLRAVPAAAVVPFFLLWFGFSEVGRYVLVLLAVAFNVTVAASQVLARHSSSHSAFFRSYNLIPGRLSLSYCLPRILEDILPTLRYSMALAIGAVTVSELLGSQVGLGYLVQTSRLTFSLNLLFLTMVLLGALSACFDWILTTMWSALVFWRREL